MWEMVLKQSLAALFSSRQYLNQSGLVERAQRRAQTLGSAPMGDLGEPSGRYTQLGHD